VTNVAGDPAAGPPYVSLSGVGKAFRRGGRPLIALDRIDLMIERGGFVSLLGPSGCGKTTLLAIMAGLLVPDGGQVCIGGGSPSEARRARHVAFVPQQPALLPWKTVRRNVTLLTEVAGRASGDGTNGTAGVDELLVQVGLRDVADAHPTQLSGGMQQRVSLARAFALRAPLLLMDEPFASLDEMLRAEMRQLLLRLWRDTDATVVFVTHDIDEAVVLSDRVVVMAGQPGRVVADHRVDLPRPRQPGIEDWPRFRHHTSQLRRTLARTRTGQP
jgi:NitT/TauT family transport system ATP-binding protein